MTVASANAIVHTQFSSAILSIRPHTAVAPGTRQSYDNQSQRTVMKQNHVQSSVAARVFYTAVAPELRPESKALAQSACQSSKLASMQTSPIAL